jgi:hypothetical protein
MNRCKYDAMRSRNLCGDCGDPTILAGLILYVGRIDRKITKLENPKKYRLLIAFI